MIRSERGQVLVLIILAAVVLFGFAALAVDGGRFYGERRRAQNAADTAALAAAYAAIDKTSWQTAAMTLAQENGYPDNNPAQDDTTPMDVHVHNPPISGPYQGKKDYYQVFIRSNVDAVFAQFVWNGQLAFTVEAVSYVRPSQPIFPGQAIVALNQSACKGVNFSGGGDTVVKGGNIFSNSKGKGNCPSGEQNGSGSVIVYDGGIYLAGDWTVKGGSGSVTPVPNDNVQGLVLPPLPKPDCSKLPALSQSDAVKTVETDPANPKKKINVYTMSPGRYTGVKITGDYWKMNPGMYCFTQTGFDFNGVDLEGQGVFLVILGGDIKINGSGKTDLTRASSIKDGSGYEWGGMLIYMPANNDGGIDLSGGGSTSYTGTILAPYPRSSSKPKCTFGGNSGSIGLSASIICDTVEVGGTANLVVNYYPKQNWQMPPRVDLSQ